MEPKEKQDSLSHQKDNDIDLGFLLYKVGLGIKSFFLMIAKAIAGIGSLILLTLFFLRRNLFWLILGAAIGLAYGVYLNYRNGPKYYSQMTVRTNFNSSRSLYSTIEYLNALIASNNKGHVSKLFGISDAEVEKLSYFSAVPVESELIVAEMYRDQFLKMERNDRIRMDTFWTRTIKFNDYKDGLTRFDYPLHQIKLVSTQSDIFPKVQQGLIELISGTEILKKSKAMQQQISAEEAQILKSSIESLDTLRRTYNERLLQKSAQSEGGGTSLNLFDKSMDIRTPELELYNTILALKDELNETRNKSVLYEDIVQVYSPFYPIGQKVSVFKQDMFKNAVIGLILTLLVLVIINLYLYLRNLERAQSKNTVSLHNTPDL